MDRQKMNLLRKFRNLDAVNELHAIKTIYQDKPSINACPKGYYFNFDPIHKRWNLELDERLTPNDIRRLNGLPAIYQSKNEIMISEDFRQDLLQRIMNNEAFKESVNILLEAMARAAVLFAESITDIVERANQYDKRG